MACATESSDFDWVCPECGSDDCEMSAWVRVNSNEVCDGEGPGEQYWCPRCEDHPRRLVQRRDFKNGCGETTHPRMSQALAVETVDLRDVRALDFFARWPYP